MLWKVLSALLVTASTVLGVLIAIFPAWLRPKFRWLVVAAFVVLGMAGIGVEVMQAREEAADAARLEAQITGRGGWPVVGVLGFLPLPEQTVNGLVVADFQLLNPSDVSVFDVRATIDKRVPIGEGFMKSDTLKLGTYRATAVHPHDAPVVLARLPVLWVDRPNVFYFLVFSRAAEFTEALVIVWKDEGWRSDYDLTQLAEASRKNDEIVRHRMADEFRAMLP